MSRASSRFACLVVLQPDHPGQPLLGLVHSLQLVQLSLASFLLVSTVTPLFSIYIVLYSFPMGNWRVGNQKGSGIIHIQVPLIL